VRGQRRWAPWGAQGRAIAAYTAAVAYTAAAAYTTASNYTAATTYAAAAASAAAAAMVCVTKTTGGNDSNGDGRGSAAVWGARAVAQDAVGWPRTRHRCLRRRSR